MLKMSKRVPLKCRNILCRHNHKTEKNGCIDLIDIRQCDQRKMFNRLLRWDKTDLSMQACFKNMKLDYNK